MTVNWKLLEKLNAEIAKAYTNPPAEGMFLRLPVSEVETLVRTVEDQDKKLTQAKQEYKQLWDINQQQADKIDVFTGAKDIAEATANKGDVNDGGVGTATVEDSSGPATQTDRQPDDTGTQQPGNEAKES